MQEKHDTLSKVLARQKVCRNVPKNKQAHTDRNNQPIKQTKRNTTQQTNTQINEHTHTPTRTLSRRPLLRIASTNKDKLPRPGGRQRRRRFVPERPAPPTGVLGAGLSKKVCYCLRTDEANSLRACAHHLVTYMGRLGHQNRSKRVPKDSLSGAYN